MQKDIEKVTLTAGEAAKLLGISYWLITQLVKQKKIPHCRLGGKILFRKVTIEAYLIEQEKLSMI